MSNINWSNQQLAIFDWFKNGSGNLVVVARAGTGKSTTILEGISHASENKILLAAFNKRIADELKNKLQNPRAEAKTLHGLGFAYIRKQWQVTVDEKVDYDRAKEASGRGPDAIIPIIKRLASFGKNMKPFATVQDLVQIANERDCVADEEFEEAGWTVEKIAGCAHRAMALAADCKEHTISFDDMVFLPVVRGFIRPWYDMVVIDEAQDMNYSQLLLAQKACKKTGRIVVVGDDRQALYGFRGADSDSINRLQKELRASTLTLTITRRCPKNVVALASKLVPDFEAAPEAPEGVVDSAGTEAMYGLAKPGDFVLSRKNAPLMGTCLRFLRNGVSARIEGRDIGKGLSAIVKKLRARSIPEFLTKLTSWENKQVTRAKAREASDSAIDAIIDQVQTLTALVEGLASVNEIESRITALFQDSDGNSKPAVVCSTVHKAKGLEATRVFVLVETFVARPGFSPSVEETNIAYVAYTRAKQHLTLVMA